MNKEKTTLLKEVSFQNLGNAIRFEPDKFVYDLEISALVHNADLNVIPYYDGVNIEITGDKYIGEHSKVITITSINLKLFFSLLCFMLILLMLIITQKEKEYLKVFYFSVIFLTMVSVSSI